MFWSRRPRRDANRRCRLLDLESLECRRLLTSSVTTLTTVPVVAGGPYPGTATAFDSLIGAAEARSQYGIDGTGMTAAVIDAGVNYNNEALGGGFGAGQKVVAGYNFVNDTSDPLATGLQHGTAVAGLIASSDPAHPGVAPGADIVALRIFNDSNQGSFDAVSSSLRWVIDNHAKYNITVVNLSISDGGNYTSNWFASDNAIGENVTNLIGQLDALNIPVVTATGNSYTGTQGQGFTSIVADSISVTASDLNDKLLSNAQRLGSGLGGVSATDLAAPGDGITAPAAGNSFVTVSGTSFAAPLVSGALILLQQVYQSRFNALPTVDQLDSWLKGGADMITDPAGGFTIGRLDIPKAIALIPTPTPTPPPPPPAPAPPAPTPAPVPVPVPVVSPTPPVITPAPTPAPIPAPTTTPAAPPPQAVTDPGQIAVTTQVRIWLATVAPGGNSSTLQSGEAAGSLFEKRLTALNNFWVTPGKASQTQVRLWLANQAAGNATSTTTTTPKVAGSLGKAAEARSLWHTRPWHTFASARGLR